jgi:hypothetical protein
MMKVFTVGRLPAALCSIALTAALCVAPAARAEDSSTGPQFALGAKLWPNEWTSWDPVSTGHNTIRVVESIASNTHLAVIPQASVRYGNWLAAASYFANTDYSLGGRVDPATGTLSALTAARKEIDGNVGYYVLPGMALTLGYKQIEQNFGSNRYKWTGPTAGVAASAPLQGRLALYGTFAYGRLKLNASTPDDAGNDRFNADYLLGELGLSYNVSTPLQHLAFSLTAGYRAQIVSTRRFDVSTGFGGYVPVDLHDVTYGPSVSLLARF